MHPMQSLQRLVELFGKHMVGLAWVDHPADLPIHEAKRLAEYWLVTGFVVETNGKWNMVLAGHVLKALRQRLSDSSKPRQLNSAKLVDGWHRPDGRIMHIPFDLHWDKAWFVDDDGDDFGLLPLRTYYQSVLQANGVQAISTETCTDVPTSFDLVCLLGLPKQLKQVTAVDVSATETYYQIGASLPVLPVELLEEKPAGFLGRADRIYGRVDIPANIEQEHRGRVEFDDIDGMSGGPLIGASLCEDGHWRYWILGVQSAWLPQSRVVAVCPLSRMVELLSRCKGGDRLF